LDGGLGPLGGGGGGRWGRAAACAWHLAATVASCRWGWGPGFAFLACSAFCGPSSCRFATGFAVGVAAGLGVAGWGSVCHSGLGTVFLGATTGGFGFGGGGAAFFATRHPGLVDGGAVREVFFAESFRGFRVELSALATALGLRGTWRGLLTGGAEGALGVGSLGTGAAFGVGGRGLSGVEPSTTGTAWGLGGTCRGLLAGGAEGALGVEPSTTGAALGLAGTGRGLLLGVAEGAFGVESPSMAVCLGLGGPCSGLL